MQAVLSDPFLRKVLVFCLFLFVVIGFLYPTQPTSLASKETLTINTASASSTSLNEDGLRLQKGAMTVTQGYGYTEFSATHGGLAEPRHNGIDIAASTGTKIYSASLGKVLFVGDQDRYCAGRAYGKFVLIENSSDDYTLLYAHLSKISVKAGQKIGKDTVIGEAGKTGLATGPHLHFTVFKKDTLGLSDDPSCGPKPVGVDVDPLNYLD